MPANKRCVLYSIFNPIVLKLVQACVKTAVSIGTVFPTKSYMEKYVINNWSCPEGTVKHPKKMQRETQKRKTVGKVQSDGRLKKKYIFLKSLYDSH